MKLESILTLVIFVLQKFFQLRFKKEYEQIAKDVHDLGESEVV